LGEKNLHGYKQLLSTIFSYVMTTKIIAGGEPILVKSVKL
jgi:hypothetical protein